MAGHEWAHRANDAGFGNENAFGNGGATHEEEVTDESLTRMLDVWNQAATSIISDAEMRAQEIMTDGETSATSIEAEAEHLVDHVVARLRQAITDTDVGAGDELLALVGRSESAPTNGQGSAPPQSGVPEPESPLGNDPSPTSGQSGDSDHRSRWAPSQPNDSSVAQPPRQPDQTELRAATAGGKGAHVKAARFREGSDQEGSPVLEAIRERLALDALLARLASEGEHDPRTQSVMLRMLSDRLGEAVAVIDSELDDGRSRPADPVREALRQLSQPSPGGSRST